MLGRLGNNLFEYAFGRVLAERHGVPLLLDGSWFNEEGWNQVSCIRRLPLKAKFIRPFSLGSRALRKFTGKHHWEFLGKPMVRENPGDHSYDPSLFEAPPDCILFGYFQSPRYFAGMEETLRNEINLEKVFPQPPSAELAAKLEAPDSVAVHVRRGDFTVLPVFAVCDDAYYQEAMNRLRGRLGSPRFYIFSDDPAWCREHFTASDQTVVDLPESAEDPLVDLHLMSLASHHIIANSTYSWWAAWIGKKPGQMVLCPSRWVNFGIHSPIAEKICDGWEIVSPSPAT